MNIKKVIKEKGWTLEKLALEMRNKNGERGVSQASVSQLINGNPTIDKLQEIAGIIGISVSELVADEKGNDMGAVITCPHCGNSIKLNIEP